MHKNQTKGIMLFLCFYIFPKIYEKFHTLEFISSMKMLNGFDHEQVRPHKSAKKKRIMHFLFFIFVFLEIREDQRNETSHL